MKFNFTQFSKRAGKSTVLFALLGVMVSSCKQNAPEPTEISAISVTNASPKNVSLDFAINDQKFNYIAIPYGGDRINYFRQNPGKLNGKVRTANDSKIIANANFELIKGKYHSLFIVGQADTLAYVVAQDDIQATNNTNLAKIRFANLSSDSPSYNLELQGDTTTFKDRTFKSFTAFRQVAPSKYKVLLKDKTTNATVATLDNVEVLGGKYYTIWAKGLVNTTADAQKLGIQVTLHL